jgi:xylan 1,4-beta-xylosidase
VVTNSAPPTHEVVPARAVIHLATAATVRTAAIERIDQTHANAKRRWLELGAPEYLRPVEVEELCAASELRAEPQDVTSDGARIRVAVDLPPNGVAAVTLDFVGDLPWGADA